MQALFDASASIIIKSMSSITKQIADTIKEHALIGRGDAVLLGLSGGPDSLCLLHVLNSLQTEFGFELRALHLNHKVRSDADADAEWLQNHCGLLGVPLRVETVDIPALAKTNGISAEEAGRIERQKALFQEARRIAAEKNAPGSVKVALAHSRDDQAETVLLRLLRGTGTHGLAAMEYKRADGLIRPLLDVSRKDIEAYCASGGLQPRIDSTNASADYTRNRVRLDLIPAIEAQFNPNIKETLCRLAANAREDDAALQAAAEQWLDAHIRPGVSYAEQTDRAGASPLKAGADPDEAAFPAPAAASAADTAAMQIALPLKELTALRPAIFKRVIVLAFSRIGLTQDIAAVHLNSLKQAADKNYGGKVIEFPHNYKAKIEKGFAVLYRSRH